MLGNLDTYSVPTQYMDKLVEIWGQPVTVFVPSSHSEVGYEDQTPTKLSDQTGVVSVGTTFTRYNCPCFIDFKVTRKTMYHFNWFPEDSDELCTAFFKFNANIPVDSFVRTAQIDSVSKWGDLLLKVVEIKEDGLYKALKRYYFLRPVVGSELHNLLTLGERGTITTSQAVPYGLRGYDAPTL